jgi:hypothetical protein
MVVIFVGLLCWGLRYFLYYSYCRILRGGSFLFPPEPIAVKLIERNGGVGIRGKNRVVDESTSCVANMNCEGFYDGETELL